MKKIRSLCVVLFALFLVFILSGCEFFDDKLGENEVRVKNSESAFVDTNYEEVVEKLQEWGFTNIETVVVYDIIWNITERGSTKSVSIDGSNTFENGDIFNKDVLVVVTYSMRDEDEPEEPEEPLNENEVRVLSPEYILVGTHYEEVIETLQEWGFTNIEIVVVYDIIWDITERGSTKDVSIDGSDDFQNGDIFDKDVLIIVTYSMRDEDVPTHTVTFDLNGGTWSSSNEQTINHNDLITSTIPKKDGHEFVGWLLTEEIFDTSTPITNDLNLVAQWYLPNYEDILVGRWEGRLASTQALGFGFLEFDGYFYDSNGERTSGVRDFDYNWGSFTLYGNKIGFNYVDVGTVYFTLSYSDDKLYMKNSNYPDIVMYRTENEPNSLAWKWNHLYQFAQTQSEMKIDEYGVYYEIGMDMNLTNLSPNIQSVESNRQILKVYSNKLIDIYFYYVGVNDPSVEMVVNIAFDYSKVSDNNISSVYISIEENNYIMVTNKGTTLIEFVQDANLFVFTTSNVQDNVNTFPKSTNDVIFYLEYFSEEILFDVAEFLLSEHNIYMFTE